MIIGFARALERDPQPAPARLAGKAGGSNRSSPRSRRNCRRRSARRRRRGRPAPPPSRAWRDAARPRCRQCRRPRRWRQCVPFCLASPSIGRTSFPVGACAAPFIWNGSGAGAMTRRPHCAGDRFSHADSEWADLRARMARPARHARARRLDLPRPGASRARRLRQAASRRDGVRAAAVFLSAHRPRPPSAAISRRRGSSSPPRCG